MKFGTLLYAASSVQLVNANDTKYGSKIRLLCVHFVRADFSQPVLINTVNYRRYLSVNSPELIFHLTLSQTLTPSHTPSPNPNSGELTDKKPTEICFR